MRPWLLLGCTKILLSSHSRPTEVPPAKRDRMLHRPRSEFAGPTGRDSNDVFFLLTPTNEEVRSKPGRGEGTSKTRMQLKKCRNPKKLVQKFRKALQEGQVDASVVGAAIQRCGQSLWWKELLEIRQLQEQNGIDLLFVGNTLLLHALASCLKCDNCTASEMKVRKSKAFQMAKAVWGHPLPSTQAEFNCALSSVLQVCVRVGSSEAFTWGDELWRWSDRQPFKRSVVTYAARMFLCEMQGRHTEVDDTLERCLGEGLQLNEVVLGTLIEATAARVDPQRADVLWHALLHHVEPNFLAYAVYAKVYLLAGQPQESVHIIDNMMEGKEPMNYRLAVGYLQSLLIVCHSSLSSPFLRSLSQFLEKGAAIVQCESSRPGKQQWNALEVLSKQLLSKPQDVCFQDLLVTPIATQSLMREWKNHKAGSNYLLKPPEILER